MNEPKRSKAELEDMVARYHATITELHQQLVITQNAINMNLEACLAAKRALKALEDAEGYKTS